jgi:glycolate oxidase FAD binding subunit
MTLLPRDVAEVQEAVRSAQGPLRVVGAATKTDLRATCGALVMSTERLAGIIDYAPAECVITAMAGTRLADVEALLATHQQHLPFDPPFGSLGATLGGTVAAGVSGPGRYRYGGVRDFVIGARVVDGEGRLVRSGGKVVKNAAGFLLHHGLVGSGGRFGVVTELTFKVFPRPLARRRVSVRCDSVSAAFEVARTLQQDGADYEAIDFDHTGLLSVSVAGRPESVPERVQRLHDHLDARGSIDEVALSLLDAASLEASCVKIVDAVAAWPVIADSVAAAHFYCAGAAAYVWTSDLRALDEALGRVQLPGLVVRGPAASRRIGAWPANPFEERVQRALDPHHRFCAAPHTA